MKRFSVVFALIVLLSVPVVVAAQYDYPGGGGSSGGGIQVGGGGYPSGGDAGGEGDVTIVDFAYQPPAMVVGPGETVTWYNAGEAPHTVDANAGAFESGTIDPGGSYSQTFEAGGVYPYHCDFHPNMRGIVVVTGM
jgi:plastocyanin